MMADETPVDTDAEHSGSPSLPAGPSSEKSVNLPALLAVLQEREDALQIRAAKAMDALNLLVSDLKNREMQKSSFKDPEYEMFRLQAQLIKQAGTIQRLIGWCRALQSAIPFNSSARKARRYFRQWLGRHQSFKPTPLPAPLEKLKQESDVRRQQASQWAGRIEQAEKTLRTLLSDLEFSGVLPGNEWRAICAQAGFTPHIENGPEVKLPSRDFSRGAAPLVSVIIPLHDQWDYAIQCLRSLFDADEQTPFEVIIVDDFSSEPTQRRLERLKHVRVLRNGQNLGFIASCNVGAGTAKGRYLLFLNSDTMVLPGWLDALLGTFETFPDAGIVGSKLLNPDGSLQEAGGIIWRDGSGANYGRNDDPEKPEYTYLKETDYVSGACLMIPRELFYKVGQFDSHYSPAYYEDTDLAFKVRAAQKKVYYQPGSKIIHFEGRSHGVSLDEGQKKFQRINQAKFLEKWQETLDRDQFPRGENLFAARDRSRDKRLLLVIDQQIPKPDQDAGSRSTLHYIRLFCDLGFNVKFIPDNFAAEEPYKTGLEQLGVEIFQGNWFRSAIHVWMKEKAEAIDFIFANRSHITIKYLETIQALPKARLLYYGHDLASLRNQRRFELTGDARIREFAEKDAGFEKRIWQQSAAVYYPSPDETKRVLAILPGTNARTIPLFVLPPRPNRYVRNLARRRDLIFVGGFAHPPNVDGVLWFLEKCWPQIAAALPEVYFRIVGSRATPEILRCADKRIIVSGWVDDEELANRYWESRMAVVPLRYGAGVKGKVVDALHHSLPVVMTSIAAEGLPGIETVCAIADEAEDFARQVIELYHVTERLLQMSQRGTEYVRTNFSREIALGIIASDLGIKLKAAP